MPQLFTSLRNAAATFGESSEQYKNLHQSVYSHLRGMQANGQKVGLTEARQAFGSDKDGLASALSKMNLDANGKDDNR